MAGNEHGKGHDVNEGILRLLNEHRSNFVSGEEMCRRFCVTRTAIWKRIKALRALGYEIEASPRSGYRLIRSPDLLSPWEVRPHLQTKWMGKTIHYFQTIDSTNSAAYQLALKGGDEGEAVIAESQEKGRGRLGRPWFSPPFLNLHLSVILRPQIPPQQASLLTLMAAVATAETIERFSGLHPSIKWPNDILLNSRKVAGLLNEIHSEMDLIHFVILGIGVNLNMDGEMIPEDLQNRATSLKEEMGQPVSRKEFLQSLLKELEEWYSIFSKKGGGAVLEAWRDRSRIRGKPVKVTSFGETIVGTAIDVDSDGALMLKTATGERKRIVAGDIEYKGDG